MNFFNRKTYPIGIDISDLSLKAVQLKRYGDKIKIQAMGKTMIPFGLVVNGEIKNSKDLEKHFLNLITSPLYGKFDSSEVVSCLPESKTYVKLVTIPRGTDIASLVIEEIDKNIPVSRDDLYYDWQTTGVEGNEESILLAAAPRLLIDQYKDFFDQCKKTIISLEIEPIATLRSVLQEENPKFKPPVAKNYLIFNIGAKRTSASVYSKNTLLFAMGVPFSGEELTETISKELEITKEQAEKAKIVCGLDESVAQGIIKKVLSEKIDLLYVSVKNMIDYYQSSHSNRGPIHKMILCGGGANIKGLDKELSSRFLIETLQGNPFINLNERIEQFYPILAEKHVINDKAKGNQIIINESIEQIDLASYSAAMGLALRDVYIQ